MKIKLKLFATLRNGRFDEKEFDINNGSAVDSLLGKAGINPDEVAIIFINGRHGDFNTPLEEGDEIALFPPIGGG